MLSAAPSTTLGRQGLHVFFRFEPMAVVGLLADLAIARDPYGAVPLTALDIGGLSQIRVTMSTLTSAYGLLADTTALGGFQSPKDKLDAFSASKNALIPLFKLAAWLGSGAMMAMPRAHYMREDSSAPPPPVQLDEKPIAASNHSIYQALATLSRVGKREAAYWFNDAAGNALASATLQISFARIARDSLFSGPVTVDSGQSREMLPLLTRTTNLLVLLSVLHDGIMLAGVREKARFFMSPPVLPILDFLQPGLREQALDYAKQVLAIKVHPWVAEAERFNLVAARQTPWSTSTSTQGLAAGGRSHRVTKEEKESQGPQEDMAVASGSGMWADLLVYLRMPLGEDGTSILAPQTDGRDMREVVTASGGALSEFVNAVKPILLRRSMLPASVMAKCETLLGYTQPSAPPAIMLHGDTWAGVVRTGDASSEAVNDWTQLVSKPQFALRPSRGMSEVFGDISLSLYNAKIWQTKENGTSNNRTGATLTRRETPPLYVSPEIPAYTEGFGLQQTPPEAIRPYTDTEYFGDEDAQFIPFTPDGVAQALGYPSVVDLTARATVMAKRLVHLFEFSGGRWTKLKQFDTVNTLFISDRTRQPWRRTVEIPVMTPYVQVALDLRAAPQRAANVESAIMRTQGAPNLGADMLTTADHLADMALKSLGSTNE